jgi:hypothetical protein
MQLTRAFLKPPILDAAIVHVVNQALHGKRIIPRPP